jgi:hypothetical protein
VAVLAGALAVWGALLAFGAYRGGATDDPDVRRGLIVAVAVLAFLALWGLVVGRVRRGR